METQPTQDEQRRKGPVARLARLVRQLLWAALVIASLLFVATEVGKKMVNQKIKSHLVTLFGEHYDGHLVTIESVRRIPEKGLEVRGLRIFQPPTDAQQATGPVSILSVDEMLIACDVRFSTLARKKSQIRQITVRRGRLMCRREADGSTSIDGLWPPPNCGNATLPAVVIEDGTISVIDETSATGRAVTVRDIHLMVSRAEAAHASDAGKPGTEHSLQVRGRMTGDHFRQATVSGFLTPASADWSFRGKVEGLDFSSRMRDSLPGDLAQKMAPLSALQAQTNLDFQVSSPSEPDGPVRFSLAGTMQEGRIADQRLPYALTDLSASVTCDNRGVRIQNLQARSGGGTIALDCNYDGFQPNQPLTLTAKADGLSLDQRLIDAMPDEAQASWRKFSPSGVVDLDVKLTYDGQRWQPEVHVDCHDVSFAFYKFPYRLTHGYGKLHLVGERLYSENLRAISGGETARLDVNILNPGPDFTGQINISVDNPVQVDEGLYAALKVASLKSWNVVRSLSARGRMTFHGTFVRNHPGQRLHKRLRLGIFEAAARYEKFSYPLDNIRGMVVIDDDDVIIERLEGSNDSGFVICEGRFDRQPNSRGMLNLNFVATDVPLEDELRRALPADIQNAWSSLRPRGSIDHLTVGLQYDVGQAAMSVDLQAQKWSPKQNVEGRSITVRPSWFPYRMDDVTGTARFRDGKLTLENIRCRHGQTQVRLGGECEFAKDHWRARLTRVSADDLQADRDLLTALPRSLGSAVSDLRLAGLMSLDGAFEFSGRKDSATIQAGWDLTIDLENGRMSKAFTFHHIHGGVRLTGAYDGRQHYSRGQLNIDSMMHDDVQLTGVRGPLLIEPHRITFGSWTWQRSSTDRPHDLVATVMGGQFSVNAEVKLNELAEWSAECSLKGADLGEISRRTSPNTRAIQGKAFGLLRLSGNGRGTHTWRGDGFVRLREADIYELPLMVAVLSLLSVRPPEKTAFTNCDADFQVRGEDIMVDRLDFTGDAISLKGRGVTNLKRELNLQFYALVGRNGFRPPLLTQVFRAASRQILLIEVKGTADSPEVMRKAFPQLEEAINQIFPEVDESDEDDSASSNGGLLRFWRR